MKNPEIKAIDILLQERMPRDMLITKEKKEKTRRIKYTGYDNYTENKYTDINDIERKCNVLSSEDYLIKIDAKGEGFSKYKDIYINKYKSTNSSPCGIFFYIKNKKTEEIWTVNSKENCEKYEVTFAEDFAKISKRKNGIDAELKVTAGSRLGSEIRSLNVKNNLEEDIEIEVISYFEPNLSRMEDDNSHPAFNNLFLKFEMKENNNLLVKRNRRGKGESIYLGINFNTDENCQNNIRYEIDKEKFHKIKKDKKDFSNEIGLVTEPCIALKHTVKIESGKDITFNLSLSVGTDEEAVIENLEYYKIPENVEKEWSIARTKAEEEVRYLNLSNQDINTFNLILPYVMSDTSPIKALYMEKLPKIQYFQSDFWKYGISGDLPIIVILVKSPDDVYMIKELLNVHEYLRAKGIKTDLVILDYEKNIYERYVKDLIIQEILNMQIGYMQNTSGGIFLLNSNEIEDEDLFKIRANIVIDAQRGSILQYIEEMEEEYRKSLIHIEDDKNVISDNAKFEEIKLNIDFENLKFNNGFGGFSEDRKRIYHKNK